MRAITASAFNDDVGKTVWATPGTGDLKPEVPQTQAHIVGVIRVIGVKRGPCRPAG
jgi:hypothetical protein